MAIIYKITNNINGKVYIGETVRTLNARWNGHMYKARNGSKEHLYAAIRYYGEENFFIEEIDRCPNEKRFEIETSYIIKYNSLEPNGYNWLLYQSGPNKYCEDIILQDWYDGLSLKGISEKRHIGIKTASAILKSVGITQEEIYDRRSKGVGIYSSKIVNQYDIDGNLINSFPSATAAAKEYGYNISPICKSCCEDLTTAYGFIWQYDDSDNIEDIVANANENKNIGKNKKKIIQKTLDGEYVQCFESASAAGRVFGKSHANIARAARDSASAYGFLWEYTE